MFFSKIDLNYRNRAVAKAYSNCQEMHSLIMSAFPKEANSKSPRNKYGVIYKIVETQSTLMAYVYSKISPNWNRLMEKGVLSSYEVKNIDGFISGIKNNDVFKFQLSVFMSKRPKDKETGKSFVDAVPLTSVESKMAWLERAAENNGFEIVDHVSEIETKKIFGIKNQPKKGFILTTISGCLLLKDAEKFVEAYSGGIGRCKAYGAGMMLLSR